jgi:hypothetical protein
MFYSYLHRRNDTGQVCYIGKGMGKRAYSRADRNVHWRRIEAKHGITVEIVAHWPTEAEAFEHEIFLIDTFRSLGHPLVNLTNGGDGVAGHRHDAATLERMSARCKAVRSTPESRAKTSAQMKLAATDPEFRRRISEQSKAAWADPKRRAVRTAAVLAAIRTPEHRAKRSAAAKELLRANPNLVAARLITLSAIHRSNRKRVECIDTGEIYSSITDAARAAGVTVGSMSEACRGLSKTCVGRTFRLLTHDSEVVPPIPSRENKRRRRIECIDTGAVYQSITEAARAAGVAVSCMSEACRGITKTSGGKRYRLIDPLPPPAAPSQQPESLSAP